MNCQAQVQVLSSKGKGLGLRLKLQGVPKKTLFLGFWAITPLWKGLEIKVGGVLKTSGNSLCDRHKNFPNWPFRSWEYWVQRWQLNLKNLEKNWENFVVLLQLFPFASIASFNFSLLFHLAGIPHDIQNVDFIVPHKFKHLRVSKKKSVQSKRIFSIFFKIFFRLSCHL